MEEAWLRALESNDDGWMYKQGNTETVEETILSSFETSTDYSLILENDNATLEDWLSALEDETTEIVHSFDAILNDSITDVSR